MSKFIHSDNSEIFFCNPSLRFSMLTKKHNCSDCYFAWGEIEQMINKIFLEDGEADLYVLLSDTVYYYQIRLIVINKKYKIFIHTTDESSKNQLLEWWNPDKEVFEGYEVFDYIDNIMQEDKRTIGSDINLAKDIFKDFFVNGQPSQNILLNFRSIWNPKPKE